MFTWGVSDAERRAGGTETNATPGRVLSGGSSRSSALRDQPYRLASTDAGPGTGADPGTGSGAGDASLASAGFAGQGEVDSAEGRLDHPVPGQSGITEGTTPASDPPETITVSPTPSGVATGVTHLAVAHETMGPARSHPEFRGQAPRLATGEETEIPSSIREAVPKTGIEIVVPATFDAVFVAAPLAFYLGATLTVGDRRSILLRAADVDVRRRFEDVRTFQRDAATMLRRVFYLDCLVRRVESDQRTDDLLAAIDLDPPTVRDRSPTERLRQYLEVPTDALAGSIPDWHLSTYARPGLDTVSVLPHLLDRLSLIFLPAASALESSDLLERTLSDAYVTRGGSSTREGVVKPERRAGRVKAWLAPGTPIEAFKTTTAAFENRNRHRHLPTDGLDVAVVLNDGAMHDERVEVEETYRERSADCPIDVTVHERLARHELASVFEERTDFVHYIGHCDEEGLRCADGILSLRSLDAVGTRTFFLNACGSYDEGLALVERGAIAGAVTFRDVLDGHAATVGTAFARLFVHGFSIERAMQLARKRILMGSDYAVVGDGTYALTATPAAPVVASVESVGEEYRVSCEVLTARQNGESYRLPFAEGSALNGSRTEARVTAEPLVDAFADVSIPIVYEGDLCWSGDFVDSIEKNPDTATGNI